MYVTGAGPCCQFARGFADGLAAVSNGGPNWGYIDKTGKFVIKPQPRFGEDFVDGLAVVNNGTSASFIDKEGKYIIRTHYKYARSFANGFAPVGNGTKWGYIS